MNCFTIENCILEAILEYHKNGIWLYRYSKIQRTGNRRNHVKYREWKGKREYFKISCIRNIKN